MHIFFDDSEIENKLAFVFRPKKYQYSESELGYGKQNLDELISPRMAMKQQQINVERIDFQVQNLRKEKLQCSLYVNKQAQCKDVIVVYLHGNAGTRLDSVPAVKHIVQQMGIDMCSFDFSGCGKSEGDFVSLGLKEQDDLQAVLEKVIHRFHYKKVILYGRSMGGVTSLLFSANRPLATNHVIALIIDSPFCSLKKLATEIADEKVSFFGGFIAGMSFDYIRDLVKKMTHGHDIFSLEVDKQVSKCTQYPALFCYSYEDKLIKHTHSEKLIANYGGKATSFIFSGDHNAFRDDSYFSSIKSFLKQILTANKIKINLNQKLHVSSSFSGLSTSQSTTQLKSNLSQARSPSSNLNLQGKFQIYQQQVMKNQQVQQSLAYDHSSSSPNNLLQGLSNSTNNPTSKISQSQQNNSQAKQSIEGSITSPQSHNNLHNQFHKQQSLPVQIIPQNNYEVNQNYAQIRTPSECATRISLYGQNGNNQPQQLQNSIIPEISLQKSTSIENSNNNDKPIGVTQISGIRKIPSQPLVFPNEINQNKRVSLIDYSQSQRQLPSNTLIDFQSPPNKIQSRESLAPTSQQATQLILVDHQEKKDEKRRQSIFQKINSVQLSNSNQKLQAPQNSAYQPSQNILKQINQPYVTSFTDNVSGIFEQKQNRTSEAYFLNQNHRQSLVNPINPVQNTSSSGFNQNSVISTNRGSLLQDTSKSIANFSSPFLSPRTVYPFQQSVPQQINLIDYTIYSMDLKTRREIQQ